MILDKKRTIQDLTDDVSHVDSDTSTSKGILTNNNSDSFKRQRIEESISNRYLCRPRLDSDANYYLSLRHSNNTTLSWNLVDAANRAFECEVIDKCWEEEEWYMLPECEMTVKLDNSPKSQISHFTVASLSFAPTPIQKMFFIFRTNTCLSYAEITLINGPSFESSLLKKSSYSIMIFGPWNVFQKLRWGLNFCETMNLFRKFH
jgi:hypothetical protein